MIYAKLNYSVFDRKYSVNLGNPKANEPNIEENHFGFDFQEKKLEEGTTIFTAGLKWETNLRPSVGLKIKDIIVRLPLHKYGKYKILQHGYQSWSYTTVYEATEKDISPSLQFLRTSEENIYSKHTGRRGEFLSEGLVLLYDPENKENILWGIFDPSEIGVKFRVKLLENSELEYVEVIYDIYSHNEFKGIHSIQLTPIVMKVWKGNPYDGLENYSKELAKKYQIKLPKGEVPRGWCSWYYFYTSISEKVILDNLKEVKEKNLPIEFFQIDDGYQKEIGDWLIPNHKFPAGMKFLAEEIKKVGLKPGIWLAPFLIRPKSEFFKMYPEAVIKDEKENFVSAIWQPLWGLGHTYALDVTHPTAIDYIETVFHTITKEWGYEYLKLDFLYAGCLDGVLYNNRLTPVQRYRNILEKIRKVVGNKIFILGCGAPMFPSLGFFEGMRVSCDITPFWSRQLIRVLLRDKHALCTERALINTLYRAFMHRNFWLNDPDCLIVRKDKNQMTYSQTILMATVMGLSGGMLLMSDNLSTLDTVRLPIFLKAVELNKKCQEKNSIPLGLMEYKFPVGFYNPSGILGVWNPTKKEQEISFEFPYGFDFSNQKDFWTQKEISFQWDPNTKTFTIKLKPFESIVLGVS